MDKATRQSGQGSRKGGAAMSEESKPTQALDEEQPAGGQRGGAQEGIKDMVVKQVTSQVTSQLARAADGIDSLRGVFARTGEELSGNGLAAFGEYADQLSTAMGDWSDYLRTAEMDQVLDDIQGYARRHPAVFVGTCFVLGFAVARFLKSSSSPAPTVQAT